MKCPDCLHEFSGDSQTKYTVCPNCKSEVLTLQAIKLYQTFDKINTEKKVIAQGENYQKVDALLEECKYYINNGEFENALMVSEEALSLSNVDGRIYLTRVYIKTKNFTDFEDESHYTDLKKAIELANAIEKDNIKKIYSNYHRKRTIPKEEFEEYENQEAESKLKKVEKNLKDGIPKHFSREKTVKILLPVNVIVFVALITTLILSLALNNFILSIVATTLFLTNFITFTYYLNTLSQVKLYNAVLDLYDNLSSFELSPHLKLEVSKTLEKYSISVLNGESQSHKDVIAFELTELLMQNEIAKNFVLSNATLKKFI